jgi:hypothetical protein
MKLMNAYMEAGSSAVKRENQSVQSVRGWNFKERLI